MLNFFIKPFSYFLSLLIFFSALGCGGQSGSAKNSAVKTPTPVQQPEPEPEVVMVQKNLKGIVSYTGINNNTLPAKDYSIKTKVEIRILNNDQVELSSAQSVVKEVIGKASFDVNVDMPSVDGIIVINIKMPGFAGFSRRYTYKNVEDFSLNLVADLKQASKVTIPVSTVTTISGKQARGFSFTVVKKADGTNYAKPGLLAKTSSSEKSLGIVIPVSAVPTGVTELDASLRSFDPNDQSDSTSFPGAYADSDGNTLLSVAFDFAEIKTNTGDELGSIVKKQFKQSGKTRSEFFKVADPVIINRGIPAASCPALEQIGDADPAILGFQVPVYTYNSESGLWDLLGKGTIYDENGTAVAESQTTFDCNVDSYTLEIEVTNEIFLSNWWNLDYPLIFEEPVELCTNIEVHDTNGNPVKQGHLSFFDDDSTRSFSQDYFYLDKDGRVTIRTILTDGSDDRTGRVIVRDAYIEETKVTEVILQESCENQQPTILVVDRPALCLVKGQVFYKSDDAAVSLSPEALPIYSIAEEGTFSFDMSETNANGEFNLSVLCDVTTSIYSLWGASSDSVIQVNVNNTVDLSELSDNSETAVLNPILIEPTAPVGYVVNKDDSYSEILIFGLDIDKNYPLVYQFDIVDGSDNVVKSFSGSLNTVNDGEVFATETLPFNISEGFYLVIGTITDDNGLESDISGSLIGETIVVAEPEPS